MGHQSAANGDSRELIAAVYDDMRRIAAALVSREYNGDPVQRTSLVHDVCLRLARRRDLGVTEPKQLLGVAAHLMRLVLVDRARSRARLKRRFPENCEKLIPEAPGEAETMLEVDRALDALERLDARQAKVVELRYFAGLSIQETAAALGISERTVKREWAVARAWLHGRLKGA